jgi:hypothetical protein
MPPAGLNALKRTDMHLCAFKCPLKKNAAFLPMQYEFKLVRQRVNAVVSRVCHSKTRTDLA